MSCLPVAPLTTHRVPVVEPSIIGSRASSRVAVWGAAVAVDGRDAVRGGAVVAGGNGAAWVMGNDGDAGRTTRTRHNLTTIDSHSPTCPPLKGSAEGI